MHDTLMDYITGRRIPDIGPEGSRQLFEKFLVEERGYQKTEVRVDEPIGVTFQGTPYHSTLDLVVFCGPRPFMAVKCIAGSLGSYEREILAGARLVYDHQIPFSISTNGRDALVRDVITGKRVGQGLDAVFHRSTAEQLLADIKNVPLPRDRKEREMILFRSYNLEKYEDECGA